VLRVVSASGHGPWRVIDTGLRPAAENIAINRVMLEAHQAGHAPHTLRFLRFRPSALVGFHQSVEQELRTDYCAAHGIEIQRRITGGGAIYFDETQIGWELYLDRRTLGTADMQEISRRICEMAAAGIRRLGVDARFRPRNDIEVDGRKISGTGGAFEGDSIMYQGTLLIDFDIEKMLRVLRIPAEKLSHKAIASARERVANLKDLLGVAPARETVMQSLTRSFAEGFDVEFEPADTLNETERQTFPRVLAEIGHRDWINLVERPRADAPTLDGLHKAEGGLLRVALAVDVPKNRIKQAWFTGDFFVNPRRLVADLEAALRDSPLDDFQRTVDGFFRDHPAEMLRLQPGDFSRAIENARSSLRRAPVAVVEGLSS
jgi:lipoate---protein ligase